MSTWILVANASIADLYSANNNLRNCKLKLVKNIKHPASREKGLDLISDCTGNRQSSHSTSAYEANNPKTIEAENFAMQLCKELSLNHRHNDFTKLIIIAAPKFYGLMQKHLDRQVPEIVHIPKDYTKCKPETIAKHITEYIYGE